MTSLRPSRSTWFQRAGLVLFGVGLALALTEGTLQVLRAANLMRSGAARPELSGRRVVYAVGDSHTWGYNVHRFVEAMPVRLEARLNRDEEDGPFVVENLGFPGFNTAQSLERLQEACARHPPDLVVVLAGFNDAWNAGRTRREEGFLVLPRLLRLWWLARSGEAVDDPTEVVLVEGEAHYRDARGNLVRVRGEGSGEELHVGDAHGDAVQAGLTAIVSFCRELNIPVALQTYASAQNERFRVASDAARRVAEREGIRLVDHARWFAENRIDPGLAFQPDGHPTALGCDRMAESLEEDLRAWPSLDDWIEFTPAHRHPQRSERRSRSSSTAPARRVRSTSASSARPEEPGSWRSPPNGTTPPSTDRLCFLGWVWCRMSGSSVVGPRPTECADPSTSTATAKQGCGGSSCRFRRVGTTPRPSCSAATSPRTPDQTVCRRNRASRVAE